MQGSGRVVVSIIIQHARWPEFDEACWSPTATILGGQQGPVGRFGSSARELGLD